MAEQEEFLSLVPVLLVDEVEPCIRFWTDRFGFELLHTVPDGEKIGFAMMQKDGVQLMYQTWASVQNDIPALADRNSESGMVLYFSVRDIDPMEKRLAGIPVVVPRRRTFYGATEVVIRDPAGYPVCLAQHDSQDP